MKGIVSCVAAFRDCPGSELELRLGTQTETGFVTGVSAKVFLDLEQDLQELHSLRADPEYTEVVDYFYATAKHTRVRTRVVMDAQSMLPVTTHITKGNKESVVVGIPGAACRVAWSDELPVTNVPSSCLPSFVRVKQRRCFVDVRDERATWSYELSRTWSGPSRLAVEHLQRTVPPVYEVECELVDEGRFYLATRTDEQVASSLLLKAALLLGQTSEADLTIG